MKAILRYFPLIHHVTRKIYWNLQPSETKRNAALLTDRIANAIKTKVERVYLVKIGAHDGKEGDPLYTLIKSQKSTWSGLFVEPVKEIAEKLRKNYPDESRFVIENVAISEASGTVTFHRLAYGSDSAERLPYADQIGSVHKDHVAKHLDANHDAVIVSEEVPCVRLGDLLRKHGVEKIDVLHIDAEGNDWIVLSQLDFKLYKPTVILIEHNHISSADKACLRGLLSNNSYRIYDCGRDYLAVKE